MPAVPSIISFKQWLRSAPPALPSSCSIALHGTPGELSPKLAHGIASYLNEFDADSDGRWLAVPPDLVPLIAEDPNHRDLLGLTTEPEHQGLPTSPYAIQKAIAALATIGYVVLDSPLATAATCRLKNVFHVGFGLPPDSLAECHIILNPALFHASSLPQIVGDIFLEWLNFQPSRSGSLHSV